ncbi:hypothetical protein AB0G32_13655 [Streptomyces sp. NPDC023723]|uniref:hypothetical protein n=1 Tax=Streptomyces sp. NPDC023723 TaxID=3154323 RepID=UPI00340E8DA9
MIDAETHQVLDLLPERDAATLAPWLAAHPETEVICRGRAGAYAGAATPPHRRPCGSPTGSISGKTSPPRPRRPAPTTAPACATYRRPAQNPSPHGRCPPRRTARRPKRMTRPASSLNGPAPTTLSSAISAPRS